MAILFSKYVEEAQKEASLSAKSNKATMDAARSNSASTVTLKLREADTARKGAAAASEKRATYAKGIATKNADLMRAQTSLTKEEDRLRSKVAKDIERQQTDQLSKQRDIESRIVSSVAVTRRRNPDAQEKDRAEAYDVFISHASEDKDDFVRELAEKSKVAGLKVFYDEMTLTWGDSLRAKIDYGLANSRFGVVVLSEAFFQKEWPQRELDGLFSMEN